MPVIINWAANILFGWAVVMVARRNEELHQGAWGWIALLLIGYESLVFTPVAVYLFRFYPHWSTNYLFDPDIYPRIYYWAFGLSALVVVGNYLAVVGSYLASRWLLLRRQTTLLWLPAVVAVVAVLVVVVSYGSRLLRLADFYQYWGGGGVPLLSHPAGLVGLGALAGMAAVVVLVQRWFGQAPAGG